MVLGLFGFIALVLIFQHQPKPAVASLDQAATVRLHRTLATTVEGTRHQLRTCRHAPTPFASALNRHSRFWAKGTEERIARTARGDTYRGRIADVLNEPVASVPIRSTWNSRVASARWAEINPSAASAYVEAWPEGSIRTEALGKSLVRGEILITRGAKLGTRIAEGESKMSAILESRL